MTVCCWMLLSVLPLGATPLARQFNFCWLKGKRAFRDFKYLLNTIQVSFVFLNRVACHFVQCFLMHLITVESWARPSFLWKSSVTSPALFCRKLLLGYCRHGKRQMKDFLPGGIHHNVKDPQCREKLKNCHLTNLFGEQGFGGLDCSIFKRRNASHRSPSIYFPQYQTKQNHDWVAVSQVWGQTGRVAHLGSWRFEPSQPPRL